MGRIENLLSKTPLGYKLSCREVLMSGSKFSGTLLSNCCFVWKSSVPILLRWPL